MGVCGNEPRSVDRAALQASLARCIDGDVRFDALTRTIYSTDAGIYEIIPAGVVMPRHRADVIHAVTTCADSGVAVIARGAGTGLAGGAVGWGVQLDVSRYMNKIGRVDRARATIRVQAGVVLDRLNRHLAQAGLHFAPDVATSSRATIGGMIANNSCGAYSVRYGRTVDHVSEVDVVLASGECVTFSREQLGSTQHSTVQAIEAGLTVIRDDYADEIERRFPKVLRSNGGYGLDRLGPPGGAIDPIGMICGSEGTLGVVVAATLRLTPLPKFRVMAVLRFENLLDALRVTPAILEHQPAAVELIDRLIIDAGLARADGSLPGALLADRSEAWLVVELFGKDRDSLRLCGERLLDDRRVNWGAYDTRLLFDARERASVWALRKAGLGLLMSKPGDAQPYPCVEDSAVDPNRLAEYIARFQEILEVEGVRAAYYAHASVGCLHVRPILNLKHPADVERMKRIAEKVSDLALEFGGAMTGEHGDGLARSCWIRKMYGATIVEAMGKAKNLFDPKGLMNPGKIVDPLPMTDHLRQGAGVATSVPHTTLDFSPHGGMAGLAGMCSGVGQCRQELEGTMCPSYMATADESHTTRARANALRIALSNRGLLSGLEDDGVAEVMDLCLLCKACKTECPTGVDMASLKVEFLHQRNLAIGASADARFIADFPELARRASRFPRTANAISRHKWVRRIVERRYGLDSRIAPPRFAHTTFRSWFHRHARSRNPSLGRNPVPSRHKADPAGRTVIYFVDTWTNYFTPEVGIAAVRVLEALGHHVVCPHTRCCGRPAISKGLLLEARQNAIANTRILMACAPEDTPILGTEPSCLLTLVDEYPQLMRTRFAERIANRARLLDSFLADALARGALPITGPSTPLSRPRRASPSEVAPESSPPRDDVALVFHGHCHQKAMAPGQDTLTVLHALWGDSARELDAGCCGMAGAFGREKEHYDVARAVGEHRLFPLLREVPDARVAVSGFSCREQIMHHAARRPRHWIEYVADRLLS